MAYTFPDSYPSEACYLVPIDAALLPLVAGALKHFEERRVWHSDEEHERAYNAFAEIQAAMTLLCAQELIESNNRIYRMLSTAIFGTEYTVQSDDPLVVLPELTPTHDLIIENDDSILGRMEMQKQLLENALNGTETPNYIRQNGVRDLLEQLITALQQTGQLDDDILAKLAEIAVLVG